LERFERRERGFLRERSLKLPEVLTEGGIDTPILPENKVITLSIWKIEETGIQNYFVLMLLY
jgi:hypothetical protein